MSIRSLIDDAPPKVKNVEISIGTVHVRVVPTIDVLLFEDDEPEDLTKLKNQIRYKAKQAALMLCESDGSPIYTIDEWEKVAKLGMVDLGIIYDAGFALNGLVAKVEHEKKE